MSRNKKLLLASITTLSLLGFLLHSVYSFSGNNYLIGLFTPVNESTWEHMKLFFFPMLLISFVVYRRNSSNISNLAYGLLTTTLLGTWLIPILFYSYRGILGFGATFLDIATFYVSTFISFYLLWKNTLSGKTTKQKSNGLQLIVFALTILQAILFISCTYNPLSLGIFAKP